MMFRLVSSLAACGLAVVAHAGVLEANQHDFTASFVNPPWDYESPHVNETCLKAPGPVKKGQARMVFSALPEGTPPQPSGKWPVFVHLVDMAFRATTPETKAACPKPNQQHGFDAFSTPIQAGDTCFGAANRSHMCDWNLNSGAMWDQRLKQLLLANGIAVVLVSPYSNDIWDTGDAWWNGFIDHTHGAVQKGGIDKQFLPALFHSMDAGDFGPLDLSKVVFHGFSAGAQMSSWMMQVLASNYSAPFPAQTKVAGAVMLSGGTYACYNDVPGYGPTPPVGSCQGCITGSPAACFSEKPGPRCSSCDPTTKPYCQQCCPRNFTEQHYQDHPDEYASHPPVLLGQRTTSDSAADLCATRNYFDTLVAHGVPSQIIRVNPVDEPCYCIGNPNETYSSGSPFADLCSEPTWEHIDCGEPNGFCCIHHVQGFGAFVEPEAMFVLNVTGTTRTDSYN